MLYYTTLCNTRLYHIYYTIYTIPYILYCTVLYYAMLTKVRRGGGREGREIRRCPFSALLRDAFKGLGFL